jgi:hypothetical protein
VTRAPNCGSTLHTDEENQHVRAWGRVERNPSLELALLCPLEVNCHGRQGKYIRVQLPGQKRILSLGKVDVHRAAPDPKTYPSNAVACYGVEARRGQSLPVPIDEYSTTDDPEDPLFYSTCYVRTELIEWLPTGNKLAAPDDEFQFHGKCVDCEAFEQNQDLTEFYSSAVLQVPVWDLDPTCRD